MSLLYRDKKRWKQKQWPPGKYINLGITKVVWARTQMMNLTQRLVARWCCDTWDKAILRQVVCCLWERLLWKSISNIRCLMLFTLPRVGRLITALSTCSAGRLPCRLITLCFVVDCLVSKILRCSVIWTMQHHLRGLYIWSPEVGDEIE